MPYDEPNRGQVHFSPRAGWMNDPNGLLHYRGMYHFYFQHAPDSLVWDTMHWGHATSPDLVHWTQQPNALVPGTHPGDLWSGGGVVDLGNTSGLKDGPEDPIVVFSGTQGVRMFYSLDGGSTFTPYDDGRIIAQPNGRESRDPKVVRHAPTSQWAMVVWSDADGNGVDFFVSPDLKTWERTSRYVADWFFECPDFTPMELDGETVWGLRDARGAYVVGDFDGRTFRTSWTEPQTITRNPGAAGGDYYAAQSFENLPDGRVVTMAWQGRNKGSVWTGNASFPVQQRLVGTPDGPRILSEPVDELRSLRTSTSTWETPTVAQGTTSIGSGRTFELEATLDLSASAAETFTLRLRGHHDLTYDVRAQQLDGYDVPVAPDGTLTLRLLVDRGQLAIFSGLAYVCRNVDFDSEAAGDELELVTDGPLRVRSLALHQLASSWVRP
ncbi:glycoside hydrolase family 32 protein [Kribbella lupini]|uniref:Glycosyl hydrolase family 32 N-terminal domain-containing protein n=1 Tax=Kribbella lupini TaxID=291602 RepID=A0ABN2C8X2_9ACTN